MDARVQCRETGGGGVAALTPDSVLLQAADYYPAHTPAAPLSRATGKVSSSMPTVHHHITRREQAGCWNLWTQLGQRQCRLLIIWY